MGKLLLELYHSVDPVSLDRQDDFARYLGEEGGLFQFGRKGRLSNPVLNRANWLEKLLIPLIKVWGQVKDKLVVFGQFEFGHVRDK